jgi:N-acyl-D-amino-acid deacylase
MDDILIRGAHVIDGSGSPGRVADVAVRDGRIVALAKGSDGLARRVVEAEGLALAPGFIDIHTHSDYTLAVNPKAESAIRQGVTTLVLGNCGLSAAPALPGRVELLRDYLGARAPHLEVRAATFAEYAASFPATSVNTVLQVGHNTLRLMAMGLENRRPSPDELALMVELLEEALRAGALGMSSGLFTVPGAFAQPAELQALGRVLQRHGGSYASHVRDEANGVFGAVREAIAVGEACGIHVQIAHLKLSGTDNWGGAAALLWEIEAARGRRVRVDCDQYPYTTATHPLLNLLPDWVQEGGTQAALSRVDNPDARERIRQEIAADGLNNFGRIPSWDAVRIAISPRQPQHAGRTIGEIAREQGCDPLDAACDELLADGGHTRILVTSMDEADVREILRSPEVLIGSDTFTTAPYGPTAAGKPHPRTYGTFARVLGHYVRDDGLLPLEQAVYRMTGGPARALGLADRGLLRQGYRADLVLFDPSTIADRATFDDPHQYPAGVSRVVVNGVVVVEDGEHTGQLPGQVLRRGPAGVG